ncbi:hypothetical protein P4050_30565 [Pseudomonas aeruginosa]|nr:hypothetical protein [Pseudomonas aeruginosa]
MFTPPPPERYILLDGINTENQELVITLYRCGSDLVGDLALIKRRALKRSSRVGCYTTP